MNGFIILLMAAGVALATIAYQSYEIGKLEDRLQVQNIQLRACGARLNNIINDLESDNAIDQLPDDALTDVPTNWLLPEGTD